MSSYDQSAIPRYILLKQALKFAVVWWSMPLDQISLNVNAFAAGQAAACKMFETIERIPKINPYDNSGKKIAKSWGANRI